MATMQEYTSNTWKIKTWICIPDNDDPVRKNLFADDCSVVTITQVGQEQKCDLNWNNADDEASYINNVPLVDGVLQASSCTVQDGPDSFNCPVRFPLLGICLSGFFNGAEGSDGNTGTFTADANISNEDEDPQEHRHPVDLECVTVG